ncbi:TNF receptor-associated factor family protein DDB_G0272340-like isoform X3 [Oscarella lobularis]|uniref:TNF receptor-associated factor family protein DDB_G0272340-like isoform X3 n=1 Tax=Oscarella lobularis TaxID=121494 RepID=UPI0033131836
MASARGDDSQSYAYVKNLNVDSLCCTICLAVRSFVLQELRQIVAEANSHLSRRPLSNAKNQLQRVVALKKMINALEIYCPKRHDGCKAIVKRDALESHLLQCDYSKVPCPTCGQSTKREVIEGHLHKQAKEISQREAEREEAKEKIIELEDSLASMKSELDDAIEQSVKIYFSTFEHRLSRERQHVEIVQLYSSIIYTLEECGYTDASCNRLCHSLVYRRPKYDVTRLDGIPIGS